MEEHIRKLINLFKLSPNTVVVTGAGISTEAGIPDFRGKNGIYRRLGEELVMSIINIDCFRQSPFEFYKFYRQHFAFPSVQPGKAHRILAELEKRGFIKAIVTQNIDNLHQQAGSRNVLAIHGTADRYLCTNRDCMEVYDQQFVDQCAGVVPYCNQCGGVLKPDVVLFGEPIQHFMQAQEAILGARLLVVIGSSLTVYPLAGLVKEFSTFTQDLVIINQGQTHLDHAAIVKIDAKNTGDLLEKISNSL
jgi:NAD-dependent deacetylase